MMFKPEDFKDFCAPLFAPMAALASHCNVLLQCRWLTFGKYKILVDKKGLWISKEGGEIMQMNEATLDEIWKEHF